MGSKVLLKQNRSFFIIFILIIISINICTASAQSGNTGIGQLTDVTPSPDLSKYSTEITEEGNVYTVTNTHLPETGTLNVFLVYDDKKDFDGIRPTSNVTAQATVAGNALDGKTCSIELTNNITIDGDPIAACQINGLRLYDNGQIITYDFSVSGLPAEYSVLPNNLSNAADLYKTALHQPTPIDVIVNKVWNDDENRDNVRPSTVCIGLLNNNQPTNRYIEISGTGDTWNYTFEELTKNGIYSVIETGTGCQPYQQNDQTDCENLGFVWSGGGCMPSDLSFYDTETECGNAGLYWSSADSNCYEDNSADNYNNEASCSANGFYWYSEKCNSVEPSPENMDNKSDCESLGYYWSAENTTCYETNTPSNYTDTYTCFENGFYYWNGTCQSTAPSGCSSFTTRDYCTTSASRYLNGGCMWVNEWGRCAYEGDYYSAVGECQGSPFTRWNYTTGVCENIPVSEYNKTTCEVYAGYYWSEIDNRCYASNVPGNYTSKTSCEGNGFYWSSSDSKCYSENIPGNYNASNSCTSNGFYWNTSDRTCYESDNPHLHQTASDCRANGYSWSSMAQTCFENVSTISSGSTCEGYGFCWYGANSYSGTCYESAQPCGSFTTQQTCQQASRSECNAQNGGCVWYPGKNICVDYTTAENEHSSCNYNPYTHWDNSISECVRNSCSDYSSDYCDSAGCYYSSSNNKCYDSNDPSNYTTEAVCTANGFHWYNNTCVATLPDPGSMTDYASCDNAHFFWYNNRCHDISLQDIANDQAGCLRYGYTWAGGTCILSNQSAECADIRSYTQEQCIDENHIWSSIYGQCQVTDTIPEYMYTETEGVVNIRKMDQQGCNELCLFWWDDACHFYPKASSIYNQTGCENWDNYWYEDKCNDKPESSTFLTQQTCEDAGYYWYENICNKNDYASSITNEVDCEREDYFWYGNKCTAKPVPDSISYSTVCEDNGYFWTGSLCTDDPSVSVIADQTNCEKYGHYWYDSQCNAVTKASKITTKEACISAGFYWDSNICKDITLTEAQQLCLTENFYWYGDKCNVSPDPEG